jgi:hypothetical protein
MALAVMRVRSLFLLLAQRELEKLLPSRGPSVIKLAFYKSIKSSYCEQICWQILDFLISCSLDVFICAL